MLTTTIIPTDVHADSAGPQRVSLSQAGAFDTMAGYERAGIAIVAEVHSVEDAEALAASRYGHRIARILVDPEYRQAERARAEAVAIHSTLRAAGVVAPRFEADLAPALAAAA